MTVRARCSTCCRVMRRRRSASPELEARLDQVDWGRLSGPYGRQKGVRNALRDLWSDDAKARSDAVGFLQDHLWHQGTVYEVSAPAVPFLADAALGDVVGRNDRIWLIALLSWIADGSSGRETDVEAARRAARERLPEFLARLDAESDPSVQVALVDFAARFPDESSESRPRLGRLVDGESSDPRRLVLQAALGAVGGDVDTEDVLRRLPDDNYYGEEDMPELRERFRSEDPADVFRDILDNIVGAAITFDE